MKKLVLVLSLLLPSVSLFAQQGTVGISGFSFVAPVKVGIGTDNGFLVDRTPATERLFIWSLPPSVALLEPDNKPKRLDDEVMTVTLPKLAFQNYSRRTELIMTYVPEIEMFRNNSDLNTWSHDAAFSFTYHAARNIQLSVGDGYMTSRDPARVLENVFLLLPRSLYHENTFGGEVDLQTSSITGFQLRFDTARSTFGQTPDPFQTLVLDNTSNRVSFTMTRLLSRTQRLRGKFSLFTFNPIVRAGDVNTGGDYNHFARAAEMEYRLRTSPSTYLTFSGGASTFAGSLTYVGEVAADKRFGFIYLGGGFTRSMAFTALGPTFFVNGVNPTGFYDALFFSTRADLTRRSTLQFRGTGASGGGNGFALESKSFIGTARFDYRLSDRTVWFASFQTFQQSMNEYVRSGLSRNRFITGIEFSLSSERDRRTNRLNEDEQYVALTDHARHRVDTPQ